MDTKQRNPVCPLTLPSVKKLLCVSFAIVYNRQTASEPAKDRQSQSDQTSQPNLVTPPAITLPKGGGAIRGMGEKSVAHKTSCKGATRLTDKTVRTPVIVPGQSAT